MPTALYRWNHLVDIGPFDQPISGIRQKMKKRAIVPHIVCRGFQFSLRDIGDNPANALHSIAQPFPRGCDGVL
ncbi:MAG TPA: hypothetical protein VJT08_11655 [Terriglobales bacterium]|nr:hypothetical protein [Acidobacteriaceae bacterium]HKR31129.1 hypothetical protein [Terriglobales bacterium]